MCINNYTIEKTRGLYIRTCFERQKYSLKGQSIVSHLYYLSFVLQCFPFHRLFFYFNLRNLIYKIRYITNILYNQKFHVKLLFQILLLYSSNGTPIVLSRRSGLFHPGFNLSTTHINWSSFFDRNDFVTLSTSLLLQSLHYPSLQPPETSGKIPDMFPVLLII